MEISSKPSKPTPHDHQRRRKTRTGRKLCISFTLVLLAFIIILIILFFTVFKPKQPVTTINSVALDGLEVSLDLPRLSLDLNLTLIVNLSIENRNKASFKYGNDSLTLLYYRDDVVGQVTLPAGKISADKTKVLNTTLTVLADRLIANPNVFSDVVSGTLPLTTYTKIPGKVAVLNVFKHHLVSYTWCEIKIDVVNQSVERLKCRYKYKF